MMINGHSSSALSYVCGNKGGEWGPTRVLQVVHYSFVCSALKNKNDLCIYVHMSCQLHSCRLYIIQMCVAIEILDEPGLS